MRSSLQAMFLNQTEKSFSRIYSTKNKYSNKSKQKIKDEPSNCEIFIKSIVIITFAILKYNLSIKFAYNTDIQT